MATTQLSPKDEANRNKQKNQTSFTFNETTTTTTKTTVITTRLPESNGEKLPISSNIALASPNPSQVGGVQNTPMHSRWNFFHNWNHYKKRHPNVHFLFPITEDTADPLSQKTLPNPQESSKRTNPSSNFVKLPFDPWNTKFKVGTKSGVQIPIKKWEIIQMELAKLKSSISSGDCGGKLRSSILNYNTKKGAGSYNLLNQTEISSQLIRLFDFMTEEAVKLERNFPQGIPVLRKNAPAQMFMNQKQILSILANAFFCTFPDSSSDQELPDINFNELFSGLSYSAEAEIKTEKLKCILHYFHRIKQISGRGSVVSFERRSLSKNQEPNWEHSSSKLSRVKIVNDGEGIENAENCLQVDFANQFVGGGVLGRGMVMEEIRFSICPELIAARLFAEKLEKNEVLVITGCEQFSKYSGYGNSFKYNGDYQDKTELDELRRRKTKIVAMDAYNFSNDSRKQYAYYFLKRELDKSFIAFYEAKEEDRNPIATGHWGCGVFGGDYQLKFLLQWMAASLTGRQMYYYTDSERGRELLHMVKFLNGKNADIGKLWYIIHCYNENQIEPCYKHPRTLFDYLQNTHFLWR